MLCFEKEHNMKKIFAVICLLSFGLNCSAIELFPYSSQPAQSIGGTIKSKGNTDFVTLPSNSSFNLLDEIFPTSSGTAAGVILPTVLLASDPYIVPIDGVNYVMVVDKKTNDWSEQDLLGINDPKDNMFLSLRALESDGDVSKLTAQEIKKAGIRLVRLNNDSTLLVNDRKKDFDLNKIDYIDMINLKRTANSKVTGIFGHFNVYLKTNDPYKRLAVGYVTFDTHSNLKILFK